MSLCSRWDRAGFCSTTRGPFARSNVPFVILLLFVAAFLPLHAETIEVLRERMRLGPSAGAVEGLRKQVAENPANFEARCLLAQAYAWSRDWDKAETEYQKILSEDPRNREALLGLARLRGYRGRPFDGVQAAEAGLAQYPGDGEFEELKNNLTSQCRGQKCDQKFRHALRSFYENENVSFTDNGRSFLLSYEGQTFHGWNAQVGLQRVERFRLADSEGMIQASHPISWRRSTLGFEGAASNNHTLLPRYRLSLFHGMPLTTRSEYEVRVRFKRYESAKVFSISPWIYYEFPSVGVTANYSISKTKYDSGQTSPALSSYGLRAQWTRLCPFKPWVSLARTKESFEAGNATQVNAFSANHYALGTLFKMTSQYELNVSYGVEDRFELHQQIKRWGVGLNYFWEPR